MFLIRLVEYAKSQPAIAPTLYAPTPIGWVIDLDSQGKPLGVVNLHTTPAKGRPQPLIKHAPALGNLRTSGIAPQLFCDNGGYVLGITPQGKKVSRIKDQHEAFKQLVNQCAAKVGRPEVQAVAQFYDCHFGKLTLPQDYDPAENITFRVDMQWVIDLPEVQAFWIEYAKKEHELEGGVMQCLVCGQPKPTTRRHLVPIKGLPGGQPSGTSLISANEDAFESFGLKEGFVSPICLECSELAAKALNHLIADPNTHLTLGGVVYCFWTRQAQTFNPVSFLSQPDPEDVKRLISSVRTGASAAVQRARFLCGGALGEQFARGRAQLCGADRRGGGSQHPPLVPEPEPPHFLSRRRQTAGRIRLSKEPVPRIQRYSRPCARNAHPLRHYRSAAAAVAAGNGSATLPRGAGGLLRTGKTN